MIRVRQRYQATERFAATNPISARKRWVVPEEFFFAETGQLGPNVLVELDESLWLVQSEDFKRCSVARPTPAA